ncbi:MAG: hypothetical protein R2706_13670 [Acidimicrobiales bacterium]
MAGFTAANLLSSRFLKPSAALAKIAVAALAVANLLSAFAPYYSFLLVLRLSAGFAMGLMTWIAWSDTAGDAKGRGEVTAVGPLAAIVASVLVAVAADSAGLRGIYLLLGVLSLFPLALTFHVSVQLPTARNPILARGVWPILIALFVFTAGGSAAFVFASVLASEHAGMTAIGLSLAMSLNAAAGIPGAKFAGRRRMPGVWMIVTAFCAYLLTVATHEWMIFVSLGLWGLAFWTAVPETFFILQDRSVHPADRVGDAQAAMAMGRVFGPIFGGVLAGSGSFVLLGVVCLVTMSFAGLTIQGVAMSHRFRRAS